MIVLAVLPGLLYFTFINSEVFFKFEASPNDVTAAFPFEYPNHLVTWAFFISIILAAVFAVYYLIDRFVLKTQLALSAKDTLNGIGLTVKPQNLAKAILLPLLTVFAGYACLGFADYFFHADFRLYVLAVKTFPPQLIIHLFVYVWFFLLFFIVTGGINNAMARKDIKEWANVLIMCLCNVIGVVFVLAPYYLSFFAAGIPMFNQSITPVLLLSLVPLMCNNNGIRQSPVQKMRQRKYARAAQCRNRHSDYAVLYPLFLYGIILTENAQTASRPFGAACL